MPVDKILSRVVSVQNSAEPSPAFAIISQGNKVRPRNEKVFVVSRLVVVVQQNSVRGIEKKNITRRTSTAETVFTGSKPLLLDVSLFAAVLTMLAC